MNKIFAKGKSYFILLVVIVISTTIGLSFCAWDNVSINKLILSNVAEFENLYKLESDSDGDGKVSIGDLVSYGNYYQSANFDAKTPLIWRVVDIVDENDIKSLYLMTEQIVAFGAFYDDGSYYDKDGIGSPAKYYNQNYAESNVRAWLNSEARQDGGIGHNAPNGQNKLFNGFYAEAFNEAEKSVILPRNLGSMYGAGKFGVSELPSAKYAYGEVKNQKVWIPSFTEIMGTSKWFYPYDNSEHVVNDSSSDKQFQYFKNVVGGGQNNKIFETSSTELAKSTLGCFTNPNASHINNSGYLEDENLYRELWRLRSPCPPYEFRTLSIGGNIAQNQNYPYETSTNRSDVGVRPCVKIKMLQALH